MCPEVWNRIGCCVLDFIKTDVDWLQAVIGSHRSNWSHAHPGLCCLTSEEFGLSFPLDSITARVEETLLGPTIINGDRNHNSCDGSFLPFESPSFYLHGKRWTTRSDRGDNKMEGMGEWGAKLGENDSWWEQINSDFFFVFLKFAKFQQGES